MGPLRRASPPGCKDGSIAKSGHICADLAQDGLGCNQLDLAIAAGPQALRLNPSHALPYAALAHAYEFALRFAEGCWKVSVRANTRSTD